MITPIYSMTSTERVLPRMALDFTTGVLDPRVTVTRALNTATRINSSGHVEIVNANLPRFDYDPNTLAPKGLLIEESRTNLTTYSNDFSNLVWLRQAFGTASTPVLTSNFATSPDGTQNAARLEMTLNGGTTTADYAVQQHTATIVVSGASYTYSIWLKSNTASNYVVLARDDGASTGTSVLWTVTPTWQRFTYTATTSAVSSVGPKIWIRGGLGTSTSADLLIYGAQLEAGAFATSYIPTTTLAVLRNADVVSMTGANFSSWWGNGDGSAVVRARPQVVSGVRPTIQFDDTTANNIIALRGNTTNPELYIRSGGSDQAQIDAGTIAANTSYRLAGAWGTNNCAASVNSGTPMLDGVATIPGVTQARLGSDGTNYLNGHLEAVEYYSDRILNATLQFVSSTAGYQSIISPVILDVIIS